MKTLIEKIKNVDLSWKLILLVSIIFLGFPLISTNIYYITLLALLGIVLIATQGINLLSGYAGMVSLGHAGLWAVGAYTYAIATTRFPIDPWIAAIISIIVTIGCGLIFGLPSLRLEGHYLAIVTIGFGLMIVDFFLEGKEFTGGFIGINNIPGLRLFGHELNLLGMYFLIWILVIVITIFVRNIALNRPGRAFMAIRENITAAKVFGISPFKYKLSAFVISAVFVSIAGILYASTIHYVSHDTFVFSFSVMFLAILIVGGMGTYLGPILGGVLLYVLPEQLQKLNEYRLLTYGIVLLLFIVFLPGGLVSIPEKIRLMLNKNKSINAMAENAKIPDEESKLLIQNMTVDLGLEKIEENKEILVIDNMHKYFSGVKAVNGVSIKVKSNTIHALIGPNGSGKTTLLDTISNIYSITSGKVYLKDEDITNVKPHILVSCGLCRTFQISQVFKHLTVLENVVIGQNHWRKTGFLHGFLNLKFARNEEAISKDYAEKVLKFVGLSEYINIKAGELPYGLQRILEIARALASKPILLMLDEPAAGMNPRESEQLLELLKRIKQLGVTIMLIEHNMQLVMKVSDYITVLDYGQVIAEGKPSDIQSNRRVIETYLGKSAVSVI